MTRIQNERTRLVSYRNDPEMRTMALWATLLLLACSPATEAALLGVGEWDYLYGTTLEDDPQFGGPIVEWWHGTQAHAFVNFEGPDGLFSGTIEQSVHHSPADGFALWYRIADFQSSMGSYFITSLNNQTHFEPPIGVEYLAGDTGHDVVAPYKASYDYHGGWGPSIRFDFPGGIHAGMSSTTLVVHDVWAFGFWPLRDWGASITVGNWSGETWTVPFESFYVGMPGPSALAGFAVGAMLVGVNPRRRH